MERIIRGLATFQSHVYPSHKELFQRLASGQNPETLFITCADSRVVPSVITQTDPGELFVCRNAGNIVPPHGSVYGGVSATVEYAVVILEVRDIIVCGHSDCGAIKGLLEPEKLAGVPNVAGWLRYAEPARAVEVHQHDPGKSLLDATIEQNVVAQIEHLETHPSVAERLASGQLQIHGWVYDISSGIVRAWDAGTSTFEVLIEPQAA